MVVLGIAIGLAIGPLITRPILLPIGFLIALPFYLLCQHLNQKAAGAL